MDTTRRTEVGIKKSSDAFDEDSVQFLGSQLESLVRTVKQNLETARREFEEFKGICSDMALGADDLIVSRRSLEKLQTETRLLKENLPRVLTKDILDTYGCLKLAKQESETLGAQIEEINTEKDHWKSRCKNALEENEREKQEKFELKCELQEVTQQLSQQSEYCAGMGAACCTLLWRVSRCEESIQAILVGTKVDEFLGMVSSTIESYLQTYKDDLPQEESEETQFILALCGIITNIAASPFGRDFLMKNDHGCNLLDIFITTLSEAPSRKCAKLKNLILMSLYNISINQKGLKYISTKPGIIGLLTWQLQEETEVENRLNSLRLLQSILYEQNNPKLLLEANEVLSPHLLQELSCDRSKLIREAAIELVADLKVMNSEQ